MTKISKKIGKMWKDMTGVSPIIAVILMVAITVVLAATIYVWVSGFGGSGSSTPAISCSPDNTNNKLIVVSADPGVAWSDITVTVSDGSNTYSYGDWKLYVGGQEQTSYPTTNTITVTAGDYIDLPDSTFSGNVEITLKYDPTNTIIGTWTVNV